MPLPPERSRAAIVISALLHLLLIYALLRVTAQVMPPTSSPIGEAFRLALGGGGGGGNGGTAFTAAPPPPPTAAEIPPPPLVVPPEVVPPPPTPVAEAPMAFRDTTPASSSQVAGGTGGGSGGGNGTGVGPGSGSGTGPGSGSGSGGGNGNGRGGTEPVSKQMIIPTLNSPKSLRGVTVDVMFSVDAQGKVLDIKVTPPIADKGYAKKFDEAMRNYGFTPARDSLGKAVAASVVVTVTF
ncbi:MAG: hypothetical protein V4558_11915 [Gemmatimonadota bacterium]